MILWLYVSFLPLPVVFSPGEDYDFLLGVIEQLSFLDLPSILVASRHVLQDVMCVHVCTRVDGGGRGWLGLGKEGERERRAIWCGALSDFGPDRTENTFCWWLKLLCGPLSGPRYEAVVRPMKPQQPTSMSTTWEAHPLSCLSLYHILSS